MSIVHMYNTYTGSLVLEHSSIKRITIFVICGVAHAMTLYLALRRVWPIQVVINWCDSNFIRSISHNMQSQRQKGSRREIYQVTPFGIIQDSVHPLSSRGIHPIWSTHTLAHKWSENLAFSFDESINFL